MIGVSPPTALGNTNPNMVEYKGLVGAVTSGVPQLSVGLGANSGNHKPRHHVYANDYYSNPVPGLELSVERNSHK